MNEDHHIVDIGPDLGRADPVGDFYKMESAAIAAP